jgi:hypothetical protein
MDTLTLLFSLSFLALSAGLSMLAWNWRKERHRGESRKLLAPVPLDLTEDLEVTSREAIERRAKIAIFHIKEMVRTGRVSEKEMNRLKAHQESFYARYYAANIFRSQPSLNRYLDELNLAEKELAAIERILERNRSGSKIQPPKVLSFFPR